MTTLREKPTFMNYTPSNEQEHEAEDVNNYEDVVSPTGCNCFGLFGFGRLRNNDDNRYLLYQQDGGYRESWLRMKVKEVKEVSEKLAGPKWKNFIRKISGYCKSKRQKNNIVQYDPISYALNFDGDDDEDLPLGFSARFAAPVSRD